MSGARRPPGAPRPRLLYSDDHGVIRDHPLLWALGEGGGDPQPLGAIRRSPSAALAMPRGSDLFLLPGRTPLGWHPGRRQIVPFAHDAEGRPVHAVACFLAPAHTAALLAAYETRPGAPVLPLYSYAAVGFARGRYWTAAQRVDSDPRQDPWRFDLQAVRRGVAAALEDDPQNALLQQLRRCALEYQCRAAQNFYLGRHEAPLPISTACNARCLGCISLQADGRFKAAHERLGRAPSAAEIARVAAGHIARVPQAVVSFGQGCEGEPLLMRDLIRDAIRAIRARTRAGTINLNSNASLPDLVEELAILGLDSLRVSLNSARAELYRIYFRPQGYDFAAVVESMRAMRRCGRFVSLNLFYFPGVTDRWEEIEALGDLIARCGVGMVQLRNLNIDPELYRAQLPPGVAGAGVGLSAFLQELRRRAPHLQLGYFNPPKERYATWPSPGGDTRDRA
ncbi:MAG: radical SAM protein [Candidatus Eisenbacteria bacterium]|nr:radical SAM protein [Candidatus Eisenbacteria bacterium]